MCALRRSLVLGTAMALLAGAAASAAVPPQVLVRRAAARVVVIPEARSDVKVEVLRARRGLGLAIRQVRGRTVIDGRLGGLAGACSIKGGRVLVRVGGAEIPYDDLPQIAVRTPMDARVEADGAVFGSVGRTQRLELSNAGCGDWNAGNVSGQLKVNLTGSGGVHAGQAGSFVARVAGGGEVAVGQVAGPATVDIVGAGDVTASSISGALRASIAGSGDVRIDSGQASRMSVNITGPGEVRFGGVAASLDARIAGSGVVSVRQVTGPVRKTILGSGRVHIG